MSEGETKAPETPHQPHSVDYYKRILLLGNGTQWRVLMQDVRDNPEIALRVGEACSRLDPVKMKTVQTLWKATIETAHPGIRVRLKEDEDWAIRSLRRAKQNDDDDF